MRFGIALPNYGPLASPEILGDLAERAAASGADSVWVSDHLVAPAGVRSIYPYDRRPEPAPGAMGVIEHFYEPLVTLAYLAGRVPGIRLGVSAYVMPYRNPVVTAKQVASLDALSGGRLMLAIGVGWLREEFAALDVPFEGRGQRTDEYLEVCKRLWSGNDATFEGRTYRLPPVRTGPLPAQRPHPPLWIAGNSPAAIGRAVRVGTGLHLIDLSPEEVAPLVQQLRAKAAAVGRDAATLAVSLRKGVVPGRDESRPLYGDRDKMRRDLDAYEQAGVGYLVAGLRGAASAAGAARALEGVARALA